jgi:hypothetical protein
MAFEQRCPAKESKTLVLFAPIPGTELQRPDIIAMMPQLQRALGDYDLVQAHGFSSRGPLSDIETCLAFRIQTLKAELNHYHNFVFATNQPQMNDRATLDLMGIRLANAVREVRLSKTGLTVDGSSGTHELRLPDWRAGGAEDWLHLTQPRFWRLIVRHDKSQWIASGSDSHDADNHFRLHLGCPASPVGVRTRLNAIVARYFNKHAYIAAPWSRQVTPRIKRESFSITYGHRRNYALIPSTQVRHHESIAN